MLLIPLLPIPRPTNTEPQSVTDVPALDKTNASSGLQISAPSQACAWVCPCFVNPCTPTACGGLKAEFEHPWYLLSKGLSKDRLCMEAAALQHASREMSLEEQLSRKPPLHNPLHADHCRCTWPVGAEQLGHEWIYFGLQGKGPCSGAAAPISVCAAVSKMSVPVAGPAQLTLTLHLHVPAASFTLIFFCCVFSIIKIFTLGSSYPTVLMAAALLPHHVKISKCFNTPLAWSYPWLSPAHGPTRCFPSACCRSPVAPWLLRRAFDGACRLSPQNTMAFKREGTNQSLHQPSLALISPSIPFCRPNLNCASELPRDSH